ncbi:hypothetical protein PRZ48_001467 [Zasmidium cellare]|uniref:AB hydrolase-1 domain-containing protein n=1 Tax=Zasmidium cellare TaxID=395010 RepID=A0ABR0F1B3_ZASCE|nr:hypothetical protein PRZ48_001467 [Zasmidium cellare]
MKSFTTAAAVAAFAGLASAKHCQELTVPVTISARNGKYDQAKLTPHNNIDVTNFILLQSRQGTNYSQTALEGYQTVSGTYNIAATYCSPDSGSASTVQVLTHGIGFDRSYWDSPYANGNYSYVNQATSRGYATFAFDRLGIGHSSHGEPVNEIQVLLEVAALKSLTDKIRAGSIQGVPKYGKVIHIGHSFGSAETYALTAMYPDVSDGIGLTGFSQNGTFLPYFLLGGNFVQANKNPALATYVDGYLAPADASAVQTNFFAPGDFDPNILQFATQTGQPVTIGELLTIGGSTGSMNPFKGPVLIVTGEYDVPYCGGNCLAAPTGYNSIPETSKKYLPNASPFKVDIIKGAGHGLNYQYTHTTTYNDILSFFEQNGLAAAGSGKSSQVQPPAGKPPGGMGGNWGTSAGGAAVSQIKDGQPQVGTGKPIQQITDGQVQNPTGKPIQQISDGQIQNPTGKPIQQISDGQIQNPTGKPIQQISDGQIQNPTGKPIQQISDGQIQNPTGKPIQQISDGQIQNPTGTPIQQITDGQVQVKPTGSPVQQISDGQPQVHTGTPVQQISDGQVQQPTGKPIQQISDGQVQQPTGKPIQQISDGQVQQPTGSPVQQISDGQVQQPTGKPIQQISDGQPQNPTGSPVQQISDGQVQQPTGKPIQQISDGQPQNPTGSPVQQISDGQVQQPTGKPIQQISDGQPQNPTGSPVQQISDGQVEQPTGKPIQQISDGQPQNPTGTPVQQIPDGQPQNPTGKPVQQISDGQVQQTKTA